VQQSNPLSWKHSLPAQHLPPELLHITIVRVQKWWLRASLRQGKEICEYFLAVLQQSITHNNCADTVCAVAEIVAAAAGTLN
jgi:hypothetical protein